MTASTFILGLVSVSVALFVIMAVAWLVWRSSRNSGWVDTIWTFGLGLVGFAGAMSASPMRLQSFLVAAMAAAWSLRLGSHIARRTRGITDDPRYARLIRDWGSDASLNMFWLLQKQAIVSIPLGLAMWLAANRSGVVPVAQAAVAILIFVVAVAGEAIADEQLRRFRHDPANRGKICDVGLWRLSRHPNYFFEWLGWLAYPVLAIDLTGGELWGYLALLAPLCMYWLLVYVSGVPPLEEHMLAQRGDAFRRYQMTTNVFFPGLRRREASVTLTETAIRLGETLPWPDSISAAVISRLVERTRRDLAQSSGGSDAGFSRAIAALPIALNTAEANTQHYEIPARFFELILGPQRKYSCCFYRAESDTLAQAEASALEITAEHAGLSDGQDILELGCGWGSLSLWMARRYPHSRIVSVSNSASQREFILGQAAAENMSNLSVITADMNEFVPQGQFDRIVSVEMFEHMVNWRPLLARLRAALRPDGSLFLHIFTHRSGSYRFSPENRADWIAQHFFTGGIMPSRALIWQFHDIFSVDAEWQWNGRHYARTARDWLANYDRNRTEIASVLQQVYGKDARLWERRWRLFFLATAGLFGHAGGEEWGVSHYLLSPSRPA